MFFYGAVNHRLLVVYPSRSCAKAGLISAVRGCRLAGIRAVCKCLLVLCARVWKKKGKKCCDGVREKGETKLVRELMSEYYS